MQRRAVLGFLSVLGLGVLGGDLVAQGKGGGGGGGGTPPPDPAIVFVEKTSKNVFLRVMNADGSNVRTVVTGGKWDRIDDPCWSPDGSRLAFVANLAGNQGLWVVGVNGAGLYRLVSFSYTGLESADWSPTVAPDGRDKLVFTLAAGVPNTSDVLVVNPDGSGLQLLETAADVWELSWDRDASTLVGTNGVDLVLKQVAAAVGGGLMLTGETWLPPSPGGKGAPRTANTSDRIVYDTCCVTSGLQILDLSTSPPALTQLTIGGELMGSFSPDDTRLVYRRNGSLYTRAANGTGETLIRSGSCNQPYWRRN
jgi:hypothetical protein